MHENTRHTTHFVVIGNHLAQHSELSGLAIGVAVRIQSLPTGTPAADPAEPAEAVPLLREVAVLRELTEADGTLSLSALEDLRRTPTHS
ncbi:hypothetical protein [Streptomyces sp. NPDC090994]|uniref:hypothetical protein n=1 Tax=Streptomyces sp. NPDC090994 TaxID=3365969 RepID=UPI00381181F3